MKKIALLSVVAIVATVPYVKLARAAVPTGAFTLSFAHDGKCIGVPNASLSSGVQLEQRACDGSLAQTWYVATSSTSGYYTLRNANSNLYMDLRGDSGSAGTAIQQYTQNGTDAQNWSLQRDGAGYVFRAKGQNCIEMTNYSVADGALLTEQGCTGAATQTIVLTPTQGAQLPVPEGRYSLMPMQSGMCWDVPSSSTSTGVQLQQWTCNGTGAQQYDFVYVGNSQYEIHNANSGLCVDLRSSSTTNGTAIQQYTCNGTGAQHWTVSGNGDGSVTIRSSYNYNKVIDVTGASTSAGAKLQIYDSNGGANQHYQMSKVVYPAVLADGTYNIIRQSNGQCWDVPSSSTSPGVQIQMYSCNGTQAQQFDVTHVGGGYYTIVNVNSALGVAVNDYSLSSGATVVQNNPHAGDNQLFTFVPYSGGYIIRPKNSYMCVDVDEAFLFGNDQLQQYTCNQTSNQIFVVKQIPDSSIPSYLQCH